MICSIFMIACNKVNDLTDYAKDGIAPPQIMYSDRIYFYDSTGFDEELPEGFTNVGAVKAVDVNPPTHNFYGTGVEKGQEIFAMPDMESDLYIKYESGYAKYSCSESTDAAESESNVEYSQICINMEGRRIEIPAHYILSIYKNLQSGNEKVYNEDLMTAICEDINNSEIVQISVDGQEVLRKEGIGDFFQYPTLFDTVCKDDFVSVNLLSKGEADYYVQLLLTVPSDNLINISDFSLEDSIDGKRYINCFVKSEKLYRDIESFWGPKVTIDDIQNPQKIVLFYNDFNSVHMRKTSEIIENLSNEDAEILTQALLKEAYKVYDDHSFGITITISMRDDKDVNIYYADDGCSMFQFEGESYNLEPNGSASSIVKTYIQKLEEEIKK